jgi:hypothetical protein
MISSKVLSYGYLYLLLAVASVGMYRYKRLTVPFKILGWSVVALLLVSIVSKIFAIKYRNNAPILQIESIEEYTFYSLVYFYLFNNIILKKIVGVSIAIMVILFVTNAMFLQPFFTAFPTNINVICQLMYAIFSLLLFREMLNYPVKVNIIRRNVFWFNTAMLFYATTMFFNLAMSNYLAGRNFEDLIITYFWYFDIYLFHIFICVAFIVNNKEEGSLNAQ